jgi:gamma-glutamyltranspeptidase / glutathione hydrolase / leukotriene-C4 hydrolase
VKSQVVESQVIHNILILIQFPFRVRWNSPVSTVLKDNSTFYTSPLPSCGAIVAFVLNLLRDYDLKEDAISYHRIVEAFKFAYAKRTLLGDEPSDEIKEMMRNLTSFEYADEVRKLIRDDGTSEDFGYYGAKFENKEDFGTAHISILMPNGDAVSFNDILLPKLQLSFHLGCSDCDNQLQTRRVLEK